LCSHNPQRCLSKDIYFYACWLWSLILQWLILTYSAFGLRVVLDLGKIISLKEWSSRNSVQWQCHGGRGVSDASSRFRRGEIPIED
jgi:hypothetical protein